MSVLHIGHTPVSLNLAKFALTHGIGKKLDCL